MKTFCIVSPNSPNTFVRGEYVFEVDEQAVNGSELSIREAMKLKRPLSLIIRKGLGQTRFADRLPFTRAGIQFKKMKPHEYL